MADFTTRINNPGQTPPQAGLPIGRFQSPHAQSELKNFFSNLKDFLTERRTKVKGGPPPVFVPQVFGDSTGANLKELFKSAPRGAVDSDLLVNWNAGFGGFWQNLRDAISPPKLPPLQTTSKPVPVKEIWSKNTQFTRVQALSMAFHVVVLVLVILPLIPGLLNPATTKANSKVDVIAISPFLPKLPAGTKKAGGGGGGGSHDVLPASRGKLPKFSMTQFTPPKVVTNPNARLAMTPTVLGPPELKLPSPNMNNWGDPLSKVLNDSNGPGSGNGIGSGNGTGVGSGSGGGVGPGEG
ncbi:MAG: hypothetical protein WAN72_25705, partial [Candidatus Acidiferrales bacterium]